MRNDNGTLIGRQPVVRLVSAKEIQLRLSLAPACLRRDELCANSFGRGKSLSWRDAREGRMNGTSRREGGRPGVVAMRLHGVAEASEKRPSLFRPDYQRLGAARLGPEVWCVPRPSGAYRLEIG